MIEDYSFGSIRIDGKEYNYDLILSGTAIKKWWRNASHEVALNDLEPILAEKPKVIIFGTGESGVCRILPETSEYLEKLQIKTLILPTPEAVEEYNNLTKSKKIAVAGAFHLTC